MSSEHALNPNQSSETTFLLPASAPREGKLARSVAALRAFRDHNVGLLLIMASEVRRFASMVVFSFWYMGSFDAR
jgi:hypothetical protein